MSEPFLAEIRMLGFNFAPRGWAFCDGPILPINQNQSLYSLLGTTYGGDGRTNFALPDLRSRVPIHEGQAPGGENHPLGSRGGEDQHVLGQAEIPQHRHDLNVSTASGDAPIAADNFLAAFNNGYIDPSVDTSTLNPLQSATVTSAGSGQGHENNQPSLAIYFAIALQGLFPSRN